MTPYYDHAGITIYQRDALERLPAWWPVGWNRDYCLDDVLRTSAKQ